MQDAVPGLDYAAFAADLDALRARVEAAHGARSAAHLRWQARWGRICTLLGYGTAWILPNPLSALLMALGMSARWTIVAHHTLHRALDRSTGVDDTETSRGFARGARRWHDWLDWLDPACWEYEHNKLHHFHTGEVADPDLVEEQLQRMRTNPAPLFVKHAVIALLALTWKFVYYAPNIFVLNLREQRRKAEKRTFDPSQRQTDVSLWRTWLTFGPEGRSFWARVVLPYVALRFVLLPALFLPLGTTAALYVLLNSVLAELLTNLHTFVIVVPNHAGDDMHRFDCATTDRAEFYVRQVLGSVNFRTGGAVNDFLHGYLNYQVEHHLWPDMAPLLYQQAAPEVRAICARHGVPYVQEGVFTRLWKMIAIMTGEASMARSRTVPKSERRLAAAGA
jgi:fatty acid desaturase